MMSRANENGGRNRDANRRVGKNESKSGSKPGKIERDGDQNRKKMGEKVEKVEKKDMQGRSGDGRKREEWSDRRSTGKNGRKEWGKAGGRTGGISEDKGGRKDGKPADAQPDGRRWASEGRKGGAPEGRKGGASAVRRAGAPEGRRGGTPEGRRDGALEVRKTGGQEGRKSGTFSRRDGRFDRKPFAKKGLCPVSGQCGGCQLLDMDYNEQLKRKQKQVEELFKGVCTVKPIVGMKDPFHYRNKVHAVFDRDKRGNIISGIYQENSHDVVPVEKCMIEDEKADEIIGTIRGMLKSFKIRTYDEDTGYGLLRHVLVRRAFSTGEIMVVLVTASPVFPSKNNFVKALREKHPEITTIVQNVNGRGTSMVLGDKEKVLYGKGYIVDQLCGCKFRISSKSFYQINPVQTEVLYGKALELAGLTGKETVVDAYCGIGTIGIIASRQAGQVVGVELNRDAERDAVSNAKLNEIQNIRFFCNDAGRFLVNMAERGEKADMVIMDPPRSGSTEEFMDSIGKLGVKKVVYVSCNPETLVRDVKYMKKLGYRAGEVWPVDMFPATNHCEVCVELSKKR